MKLTNKPLSQSCDEVFLDMKGNDWGCKYAEQALSLGIISTADTFRPNDTVSKIEALKLILNSKNIEKISNTEDWKKDYVDTALESGLISKTFTDYDTNPNRAWIFSIAVATIKYEEEVEIDEPTLEEALMSDEAF